MRPRIWQTNPRASIVLLFAIGPFSTTSCLKVSPSHRVTKGSGADSVIDGNIEIERAIDGVSATLTFNTTYAISCKFASFEDVATPPDPATLVWANCVSPQPGRTFKETVSGLKAQMSYGFSVKLWAQGQTEANAVIKTVHEDAAPGDPTLRYLMRLDIPTKSAQIDGFIYSASLDGVQKELLTPFACKVADTFRTTPGTRLTTELPVKRVTSRGFFTGISTSSDDLAQGLLIAGASIQTGATEWIFNIQSKNTSGTVRPDNPIQLTTIAAAQDPSLSTTASGTIIEKSLDDFELAAFRIGQTAALNVSWTTDKPTDNTKSLVVVTLTGLDKDTGIVCGFDPKPGTASIPASLLTKFGAGRGFLTVQLESLQVPVKDRWLTRSIDWRSVQILLQ